ncbi:MAG TPA: hypothetical protein VN151_04385 [Terracidiphilus sp.]|nr:hypothetical protein [Terracidiphilus sp.]
MEKVERPRATDLLTIEELKEAWAHAEPVETGDPVLANVQLECVGTFYPLGFPVRIETNEPLVLELAEESWRRFAQRFETRPVHLRVTVTEGETSYCPPTPVCRMRDHIVSSIADGENYMVTDLAQLRAVVWATQAAVLHRDYFKYFFLESAAMSSIGSAYATAIHAGCVALDDEGVLLCGDSGAGKTTLTYACARAGWTYVTDDGSYLVHGGDERTVVGNCHQVRFRPSAAELFAELHGRPVMQRAGVGKPSIELALPVAGAFRASTAARVRYMVFLRRNVEREELVVFPRAVAQMYLWQRMQCMPYEMNRHLNAMRGLQDVETLELRYNRLDWAVERLAQLVREGS